MMTFADIARENPARETSARAKLLAGEAVDGNRARALARIPLPAARKKSHPRRVCGQVKSGARCWIRTSTPEGNGF